MINIFEVFLPQLLRYPNPTDPLNGEAAALLMREPSAYDSKVRGKRWIKIPMISEAWPSLCVEYVGKFATKEAADAANEESSDDADEDSLQEFSDDEAPGMEL